MTKVTSNSPRTHRRYSVVICCLIFMCACASNITRTQYYVLQPLAVDQKTQVSAAKLLRVGVLPPRLPDYANHSGIVSLSGSNQFNISKTHVWGGELDREVLRVLNINLTRLSVNFSVLRFPWSSDSDIDYLIRIHIDDFVGDLKAGVKLRGQLEIVDKRQSTSASSFIDFYFDSADMEFDSSASDKMARYQNYVRAHSQLLLELAKLINSQLGSSD